MRLIDLTRRHIKSISEPVIFEIGEGYYETGRVVELNYDEGAATVTAAVPSVTGDHRHYHVEIAEQDGKIEGQCECSYDGYPCKHIVAVMLEIAKNRFAYLEEVATGEGQIGSLKAKVGKLSRQELVEMIMVCTRKYPDFKDKLMVLFADEEQETEAHMQALAHDEEQDEEQKTIDTIREQIEEALHESGDSYSTSQTAERLRAITDSIDTASDAMKVEIYWSIVNRVLKELDEHGVNDGALENMVIDYMRSAAFLLRGSDKLKQEKHEVLEGLMEHYDRNSCGIGDSIYETVHYILRNRSDYQIVIDCVERMIKSSPHSNDKLELLANLYKEIGDEEARLRTLESNLEYGTDYWRLAQYWIEKGRDDKAMEVVKEGIEKGKGAKEGLYLYIQEHYESQSDCNAMLESLEAKVRESKFRYYSFEADEVYNYLMKHYKSTGDYAGKVKLLNLRLEHGSIDFEFYRKAKEMLNGSDWHDFERRFIDRIKRKGWIM